MVLNLIVISLVDRGDECVEELLSLIGKVWWMLLRVIFEDENFLSGGEL